MDPKDPAFTKPTKPIGGYYDEETAKQLMAETGNVYQEDAGRGWRRVVPSPNQLIFTKKLACEHLLMQNRS